MAYDLFSQLQGPQIDTNLFATSTSAGINAGNALPTQLTAGIQGAFKGIQLGQQIQENYQQSQIRQNQIDQQPVQNAQEQAQLENEQAITSINQSKAKLQTATEALQLQQEEADLKAKADNAETALNDSNSIKALQEQLAVNPGQAAADLSDPAKAAALIRNPEAGQQIIAGLASYGIPKEQYKDLDASINGALEAKAAIERQNILARSLTAGAAKQQQEASTALYELQPHLGGLEKDPNFNYNNLEVISNGRVKDTGLGKIKISGPEDSDSTKGFSLIYTDPKSGVPKVLEQYDSSAQSSNLIKNLDTAKAYWSTVAPQAKIASPKAEEAPGVPGSPTSKDGTNGTIAEQVAARNRAARERATAQGNGGAYNDLVTRGSSLVKPSPLPTIVNQSQATPVPPSQAAITRPTDPKQEKLKKLFKGTIGGLGDPNQPQDGIIESSPVVDNNPVYDVPKIEAALNKVAGTDSMVSIDQHVSNLLGIPNAKVNVDAPLPRDFGETFDRVSSIKSLDGYSPIIKGMASVESRGNPFAFNKRSGAAGLLQMTAPARQDENLTEPFDAEKNAAAGASFFQKRMDEVSKAIVVASGQQGVPIQPDIRMALASFNGGQKYILDGIKKGYTTWDGMKEYIASVKTDEATKENLSYPDKVIAATIPFMKGGNLADDSLMKQFLVTGIVEINPFTDV